MEAAVWCGSRRRQVWVVWWRGQYWPMDRDLPPLTCLSYMSPSALKLSRQPLIGGGIARVANVLWTGARAERRDGPRE